MGKKDIFYFIEKYALVAIVAIAVFYFLSWLLAN